MANINSNTFSITINKTIVNPTPLNTQIIMYKGKNELTAVSTTPTTDEYQVTITGTVNCTAQIEADNKTITLLTVTGNSGQIKISVNVENIKTYNKIISVVNTVSTDTVQEIVTKQSTFEQSLDGFKTTVSETYATQTTVNSLNSNLTNNYSTTVEMNSAIEQKASEITSTVSSTYATKDSLGNYATTTELSSVTQTANKINWLVASGTSSSNMSLTSDAYSVIANNIDLTGKVTFSCLDSTTQSTINTANSNASSAVSTLNSNSANWTNAYNTVASWATGALSGTTTINGGLIQTNTITADKIIIGDYTNYVTLAPNSTFTGSSGGNTEGFEVCNISGSEKYNHQALTNRLHGIRVGDKYKIQGKLYTTLAGTIVQITSCWRDSSNTLVGSTTSNFTISSANTWQEIDDIITVPTRPSGASYFEFKININDSQSRRAYVEDLTITKMVSGNLIVDGAIDGKTITGAVIVGGYIRGSANFMTAPDENATDGYGFRIYSTGMMYTNNTIQIEGTNDNYCFMNPDGTMGSSTSLSAPLVQANTKVVTPLVGTSQTTLGFYVNDAGLAYDNNNVMLQQGQLRPGNNSTMNLGTSTAMWKYVYSTSGINNSSDRTVKENIEYLDTTQNPNATQCDITEEDLYNFVKDDLITAKYNYIGDDNTHIGFIAQDVLYNADGSDNVVGQILVNKPDEEQAPLSINSINQVGILAGALRKAIHKIEELEEIIKTLE